MDQINIINQELIKLVKSVAKLSNEYGILDEKDKSTNGKSKIIFMIDSITPKTNNQKNKIDEDNKQSKTFWEKVNGLFSK